MSITVELFGIPRQRAGTAQLVVDAGRLGELLADLGRRYPALAADCLDGPRLKTGFVANLGGERFISDPQTPLAAGDHVLILSADAGG
jgi:molybdopterin converting factor small subunit